MFTPANGGAIDEDMNCNNFAGPHTAWMWAIFHVRIRWIARCFDGINRFGPISKNVIEMRVSRESCVTTRQYQIVEIRRLRLVSTKRNRWEWRWMEGTNGAVELYDPNTNCILKSIDGDAHGHSARSRCSRIAQKWSGYFYKLFVFFLFYPLISSRKLKKKKQCRDDGLMGPAIVHRSTSH